MEEKLSRIEILILSFIMLGLLGFLGYFIYDSAILIENSTKHVPPENCNKPASDFAVETDTRSTNIERGCGVDEKSDCIFTNIGSTSDAVKKCNELGNKCNRFMYDGNVMTIVSLVGDTINSPGNHMFVRQNGVTFHGTGSSDNSFKNTFVSGQNTSITSGSGNLFQAGGSGTTSSGYGTTSSAVTTGGGSGGYGTTSSAPTSSGY